MVPGRKFSTNTSLVFASSRHVACPSAVWRSMATERLLRLKPSSVGPASPANGGPQKRVSSPAPGISILMTSAPRSPRIIVQSGPASARVASSTRMPARAPPAMSTMPYEEYRQHLVRLQDAKVDVRRRIDRDRTRVRDEAGEEIHTFLQLDHSNRVGNGRLERRDGGVMNFTEAVDLPAAGGRLPAQIVGSASCANDSLRVIGGFAVPAPFEQQLAAFDALPEAFGLGRRLVQAQEVGPRGQRNAFGPIDPCAARAAHRVGSFDTITTE